MSALLLPLWIYLLVSEWGGGGGEGGRECVCVHVLCVWVCELVNDEYTLVNVSTPIASVDIPSGE